MRRTDWIYYAKKIFVFTIKTRQMRKKFLEHNLWDFYVFQSNWSNENQLMIFYDEFFLHPTEIFIIIYTFSCLLLIPVTFKWSSTTLTIRLKVLWPKIEEINVNIHNIHTAYVFAVICQWEWETNVDDFTTIWIHAHHTYARV